MSTKPDQRALFAKRLGELRRARSMSQPDVIQELRERYGISYQAASVSNWENAKEAPSHRNVVAALDEILGGQGELLDILGFSVGPTVSDRLDAIEAEIRSLAKTVERLARQVR